MAAMVSPPPAIEKASDSATARASTRVPAANVLNSNTPTGPFHTMVPAVCKVWASATALSGPMSRIRSSASTLPTALMVGAASAAKRLEHTTSVGKGTAAPRAFILSMMRRAAGTRSGSASDAPIGAPCASRNVLPIPPPTISWSTLSASASKMVSLVDTLEPAIMATSGRLGFASAEPSAFSSAASSGPAQAIGAWRAMPSVLASARWAVPNASLT